jgi:hypothetical protein
MHWLTRAILLCVGAIFVLGGGLFVAACIGTLAQGANAPAAAVKVGVTVQVIATVIFALVAVAGVLMIWVGVRGGGASVSTKDAASVSASIAPAKTARGVPVSAVAPVALATVTPSGESWTSEPNPWHDDDIEPDPIEPDPFDVPRPASRTIGEHRPADAEFGDFIAHCGPERNGLMYNYVSAGIYLTIGLGGTIALPFMELAIEPGLGVLIPAGLGMGAALLHLWTPLFAAPQTIELFEHGIVERLGQEVRRIELAAIEHLRVQEWYEHRFADRTLLVKAQIQGQRQLEFSTVLRGDGEQIVDYLSSAVPQTEFVEFKV